MAPPVRTAGRCSRTRRWWCWSGRGTPCGRAGGRRSRTRGAPPAPSPAPARRGPGHSGHGPIRGGYWGHVTSSPPITAHLVGPRQVALQHHLHLRLLGSGQQRRVMCDTMTHAMSALSADTDLVALCLQIIDQLVYRSKLQIKRNYSDSWNGGQWMKMFKDEKPKKCFWIEWKPKIISWAKQPLVIVDNNQIIFFGINNSKNYPNINRPI